MDLIEFFEKILKILASHGIQPHLGDDLVSFRHDEFVVLRFKNGRIYGSSVDGRFDRVKDIDDIDRILGKPIAPQSTSDLSDELLDELIRPTSNGHPAKLPNLDGVACDAFRWFIENMESAFKGTPIVVQRTVYKDQGKSAQYHNEVLGELHIYVTGELAGLIKFEDCYTNIAMYTRTDYDSELSSTRTFDYSHDDLYEAILFVARFFGMG